MSRCNVGAENVVEGRKCEHAEGGREYDVERERAESAMKVRDGVYVPTHVIQAARRMAAVGPSPAR